MKRGAQSNEEKIEEIREGLKEIDAQILKLADKQDEKSQMERTALQRMKELQLNRIKQLEKVVTHHVPPDVPKIKIEKEESLSDSPSGSPRNENSPRHYYESPHAAATAAKSSKSKFSERDKRHALGRKMGKAVQEGLALYEESESQPNINPAVNSAIEFLEILKELFQDSFGHDYDIYKPNGPIDLNLKGSQHEGVDFTLSGRLFGKMDYFIKAHDDKPRLNGIIDTIKGFKRDRSSYEFESDYHVQMLKEMISSGKTSSNDINKFLQHIVDLVEADPQWINFWRQRPTNTEAEIRGQILDAFIYKIAGECHSKLLRETPLGKQGEIDSFMQKLKTTAAHFTVPLKSKKTNKL